MAFTASDLPVALVKLDSIQLGGGMQDIKLNWPTNTIKAIAENQTATFAPLSPDQPCLEVDAWFYRSGLSYLIHSRTTPDGAQGCDLKDAEDLATEKVRLANNYDIKSGFKISRERCNNASRAIDEIARGLATCMSENRRKLNNAFAIPLLVNKMQANVAPAGVVSGFAAEGTVTNLLKYSPTGFDYAGLRALELLATANHLNDTVFVAGGAFYQAADLAQFLVVDDDKRSPKFAFDTSTMYWDTKNFDPAVTATDALIVTPTVFAFDPSVMLAWSTKLYGDSPLDANGKATGMSEDPSANYYTFSVADPMLMYRDGGSMVPFYHNVEMVYACIGRDAAGRKIYGYDFNVTMSGGLHTGPSGHNWPLNDADSASATITGIIGVTAKA